MRAGLRSMATSERRWRGDQTGNTLHRFPNAKQWRTPGVTDASMEPSHQVWGKMRLRASPPPTKRSGETPGK